MLKLAETYFIELELHDKPEKNIITINQWMGSKLARTMTIRGKDAEIIYTNLIQKNKI